MRKVECYSAFKGRHADIHKNMNEPVKHATRDVKHSYQCLYILFIQGTEVVRCMETKRHGDAGPGKGRRHEKLVF